MYIRNLVSGVSTEEIKKAAAKICDLCDVLIVIGIGGSYLGARAAIEFIHGNYYNNKKKNTPDIYFVGKDISSAHLQDILDTVKPVKTRYTLETMPHALPDSPESYLDFIKAVNRPGLGVHMDIVNMLVSPRVYYNNRKLIKDTFDLLGPQILSCHVKDAILDHSLTVSIRETECGKGGVDLKYYIEQAEKYNPEMPMIIEHLPELNQYLDAIKYVKGL